MKPTRGPSPSTAGFRMTATAEGCRFVPGCGDRAGAIVSKGGGKRKFRVRRGGPRHSKKARVTRGSIVREQARRDGDFYDRTIEIRPTAANIGHTTKLCRSFARKTPPSNGSARRQGAGVEFAHQRHIFGIGTKCVKRGIAFDKDHPALAGSESAL